MKNINHSVHIDTLWGVNQVELVWFCKANDSHLECILLPSFELFLGRRCLLVSKVSIVGYSNSVVIILV